MLGVNKEGIPERLRLCESWLLWKVWKGGKVPIHPDTHRCIDSKDKRAWLSFEKAYNLYSVYNDVDGIGLHLVLEDDVGVLDLDASLDYKKFEISSYAELSPSEKGIHVFFTHSRLKVCRKKIPEIYTHNSFITVTGHCISDTTNLEDATLQVQRILLSMNDAVSDTRLRELFRWEPRAKEYWEFGKAFNDKSTQSERDMGIGTYAVRFGWNDSDVKSFLQAFRLKAEGSNKLSSSDKIEREDYYERTIGKIREKIDEDVLEIKTVTMNEAMDLPPTEWLVEKLIPEKTTGMVWGPFGTAKTFMMMDLSAKMAHGTPWFGREMQYGETVYVLGEGTGILPSRIRAWYQYYSSLSPKEKVGEVHFYLTPFSILRTTDIDSFLTYMERRIEVPKLVVIDTLSRAISGASENESSIMSKVLTAVTRIMERLSCSVVLVHHGTKGGPEQPSRSRGHSALLNGLDFSIEVQHFQFRYGGIAPSSNGRKGKEWNRTFQPGGMFSILSEKARLTENFEPFVLHLVESGESVVIEYNNILTDYLRRKGKPDTDISGNLLLKVIGMKKLGWTPSKASSVVTEEMKIEGMPPYLIEAIWREFP